jgi:uncharacterized protein with PIN domain
LNAPGSPPRFIADVMLGRLARWLRALGYDTLYFSDMEDAALARRALAEGRILLTRDVELTRRRGLETSLIVDDDVTRQLRQVVRARHLSTQDAFTRCIHCNTRLVECEGVEAEPYVPPYVYATQTRFRRCSNCGRIYWRGTHWARMRAALDEAENGAEGRGGGTKRPQ